MKPDVTMFFPAYNEKENIPTLIKSAEKVLKQVANKYEILVIIYEGSTDGTIDVARKIAKGKKSMRVLIQPKDKKGVGYAKIMGFSNAKYPHIFYADSDNQFDLNEFKKFIPFIDKYDIIAGYRINRQDPKMRLIVSRIYNALMHMLFNTHERDLDCGFRLVSKRVISNITLKCHTGVATTEILAKARKNGFKIKEIGVHHHSRKFGKTVFESRLLNLPKPKVIINLLREIALLYCDLNKK